MDQKAFISDFAKLLEGYQELAVVVLGITYESGNVLRTYGNTFIPVPPRDHEENLLRDDAAKQASELAVKLTMNVYLGR